jgi:hypothetical protein
MPDILITVVSGETTELGLSIPGVQGPVGQGFPSGGTAGQLIIKQSATDYDVAWGSTISGITINSSIASGLTLQGTISGGTFVSSAISGATVNAPAISGGTINNATLSGSIANVSTISGGTFVAASMSGVTIFASTLSGNTFQSANIASGTFSSPLLISPTISGNVVASGGVTVFASGNSAAFFGASPVLCPSGIVIPSGGSSVDQVGAALSGVIVALQSLGLVRG